METNDNRHIGHSDITAESRRPPCGSMTRSESVYIIGS